MLIGIDHGFGMIKTRNTAFRTGLDRFQSEPPILSSDCIYWRGMYYTNSGVRQAVRTDKTSDENYWVLTLMAIAKEIIARGIEDRYLTVTIAAGLPLGDYSRQVESFRAYLDRRETRHRFVFNGETFDIAIDAVRMYPQGYAAILQSLRTLKHEPTVFVVDVGSWTTDTVKLVNGNPDGESQKSWEDGVIRCLEWISEVVKAKYGRTYRPEQIESVLWGAQVSIPPAIREEIESAAREWSVTFMRRLAEKGIDVTTAVARFIGGGAHILSSYYRDDHLDDLTNSVFIEDIAANAVGYEYAASLTT